MKCTRHGIILSPEMSDDVDGYDICCNIMSF